MERPALRYLSSADVAAAMPDIAERLRLAERTLVALIEDADLPPKIGVHPAPLDSFAHAMPAWMRGSAADGSDDLLGMKWVAGFPANAASGIPAIHASIVLSDARTGVPRAVLDGSTITATRTAAVSGAAIARWAPLVERPVVAVIGAGVQARSHLPVLAHLLPGASLVLCDRDPERLAALVADVQAGASDLGSFDDVRSTADPVEAVRGAELVISVVSFGPQRQSIPDDAFAPAATIVAVDYDMCVPASVARGADLFVTDEVGQFLANRTGGVFDGYPDPRTTLGAAIREALQRPTGRVLVTHLGVGLADVVFGDAILRAAEARGIGTLLEG